MINEIVLNHNIQLVDVHSTTTLNDTDRTQLIEKYNLTNEILDYADDENERARFEYDELTDTYLIVYNVQNENDQTTDFRSVFYQSHLRSKVRIYSCSRMMLHITSRII